MYAGPISRDDLRRERVMIWKMAYTGQQISRETPERTGNVTEAYMAHKVTQARQTRTNKQRDKGTYIDTFQVRTASSREK